MKSATINEIRKELVHLESDQLSAICLRLAKYKVENKELLTYLLYEANDEQAYVEAIKAEMSDEFGAIPNDINAYYIKKSLRRILRWMNRRVRYSGVPESEIEIRIEFCELIKRRRIPIREGTVLGNIYQQQAKKINTLIKKLPEDKRADYKLP